jgi:hypothetical protein
VVGPTALQQRRAQPPDGLRGTVVEHGFRPSVDILFGTPRFEYGSLVGLGLTSPQCESHGARRSTQDHAGAVSAITARCWRRTRGGFGRSRPSCRGAVLGAIDRLRRCTAATESARRDIVSEVRASGVTKPSPCGRSTGEVCATCRCLRFKHQTSLLVLAASATAQVPNGMRGIQPPQLPSTRCVAQCGHPRCVRGSDRSS